MRSTIRVGLLLIVPALLTTGAIPVAQAHCEQGSMILGLVNTCTLHGPIEDVVTTLNDALDGDTVIVVSKDRRWHPEVVTLRTGGTVIWTYSDLHNSDSHDPRSSGSCGSEAADLNRCIPSAPAQCFDLLADTSPPQLLDNHGDYYPVTLNYDPAAGTIQKSHGIKSGTPVGSLTGARPFFTCPSNTATLTPGYAVIPYHCGIHGGATTAEKNMRGAIILLAP